MIREEYPGAWYVDALPSGEYAVLFPGSHLQTHQGRIALPAGDEPLYHRITNVGGFQIAGQAHNSNTTWWWTADHGWVRKPVACGVSPVIFDHLGFLHISDCSIGSQGYRYVSPDGLLISGDDTYSSTFGLSEWTHLGDYLFVGQGHEGGGCLVWDGTVLRRLEDGPCRFIRAYRVGTQISVAFWKEGFGAVIYWLTLDELLALPVVTTTQPTPQPVPKPSPEPIPVPVSPVPNFLADLKALRAGYPAKVSADQCAEMLNRFCLGHPGFGMHPKGGGNHANLPGTKIGISPDYLKFKHATGVWGADVFGKGPDSTINELNVATPSWGGWHLVSDPQNFVAPTAVIDPVTNVPDPVTPSADLAALRNEVAALSVKLALLEARVEHVADDSEFMDSELDQLVALAIGKRLAALEARTYRVVIDDSKDAPRLSTSKDFGHTHRIALKVEPIA